MKLQLNEIFHLLAAMKDVATARGKQALTPLQTTSLKATYHHVFTHRDELKLSALPEITPHKFAQVFTNSAKAEYALRFLVVTALMDGQINPQQIQAVFDYAQTAHLNPHYLQQLEKTLVGDVPWLIKDIMLKNLESFDIFPNLQNDKDIDNWLFPYRGNNKDPQLAQRYENLSQLPKESFGYHIWLQFKNNNYKFPGEEEGVNYTFVMPHDSIHVLSEYDTSPYGELLVSVFTSTMLEKNPIDGHVIPVMYSFYLGIKINDLAGSSKVVIDPYEFWEAWYRGSQMQINLFSEGWSIWDVAELPLCELRKLYCVLPRLENRSANKPL
ncbi:hypothetical protein [Legionella brunensis]|uniref:Uncharacterized protein n=1 Tax=Legionella brunensis TaxID=29422 RepID=A0A0W0SEF7_9GAMM|nr:hypothetical protein [Legionella brunensis]KTC81537.1 hypothetical protein Lbru_2057 [Legionella brunensis]